MRGRAVFAAACALAAGVSFSCSSEKSTGPSGPPVVTSVNGAASPAGSTGSIVVIAGSNFGTSQANASGQVLFYNGTTSSIAATIAATTDWSNTLIVTTVPAGAVTGAMVVKTSGGTSTPVTFALTQGATFSPSTVSWTAGSALPVGLSGHAVASSFSKVSASTYASTVYLAGGADSTNTPKNTAYYSTVGASGALGAWTSTTALPQPVAFAAAAIASPYNSPATGSGYLYVIGGDSTASGKPVTPVYVGTLNATGGIAGWTTTTALPVPLHSVGAAIFNGTLYVAGGSGVGNVPVATVYSATIGASGALGTWQTLTALPFKRSHFGFGINGTYLYALCALCGDSGTVTPNDSSLSSTAIGDLIYAQLDVRSGNITATGWQNGANKLKKAVSKHTIAVAGGAVLVTAGLYNGAANGATEESYASLNADGTTSSFNGATGSSTISTAGGGNIFNHAEVGYVDTGGAFHVLVAGGDDVNTPTKKHKGTWYY